jgi:hypothetical protein
MGGPSEGGPGKKKKMGTEQISHRSVYVHGLDGLDLDVDVC